MFVSNAERVR
jgi:hypothetical protein